MIITSSYEVAMSSAKPVRCFKFKKGAPHIPVRRVERVCVSDKDVHNFFMGGKLCPKKS